MATIMQKANTKDLINIKKIIESKKGTNVTKQSRTKKNGLLHQLTKRLQKKQWLNSPQ